MQKKEMDGDENLNVYHINSNECVHPAATFVYSSDL